MFRSIHRGQQIDYIGFGKIRATAGLSLAMAHP
jgi:hypothetical protein